MKKNPVYFLESASLKEHPATLMWNRLNHSNIIPKSIERLRGALSSKKSLIYRLNGIEKNGNSIITKCANEQRLSTEQFIYEKILPKIPVSILHYYGFIKRIEDDSCWLFMEEVKGTTYNIKNEIHRRLASIWLAKMHLTTSELDISDDLPQIGTDTYLIYLNLAVKNISKNISNNELTSIDIELLNRIIDLCSIIKGHWGEIEDICNTSIPCLVHCDFIHKNVRVCNINKVPTLFVFDWEHSGWGIMVEDLGNLDLDIYWSIIKDTTFIKSQEHLQQLSNIGLILRLLTCIQWSTEGLNFKWIHRTLQELSYYEIKLSNICKKRGWI